MEIKLKIDTEPSDYENSYAWRGNGRLHYIPKSIVNWDGEILSLPRWLYDEKRQLFNYLEGKKQLTKL